MWYGREWMRQFYRNNIGYRAIIEEKFNIIWISKKYLIILLPKIGNR